MVTWILVIYVAASSGASPTQIYAIPGFQTQKACVEAAADSSTFASNLSAMAQTRCYPTGSVLSDGAKK